MKKLAGLVLLLFLGLMMTTCEQDKLVLIHTNKGDIKVKLYEQTPLHAANFVKLVQEGTLNKSLFHRVINEFMIQGGDPESIGAPADKMLGNGGVGYTIEAEINQKLLHKKGALCAARQGDNVNPLKRSSGCQFYIVHGKTWTDAELDRFEGQRKSVVTSNMTSKFFEDSTNAAYAKRLEELQNAQNRPGIRDLILEIKPQIDAMVDSVGYKYSPEEREAYKTLGGAPHLDGGYTVFGEVVEGLDVIDSIAVVPVGKANRPVEDIWMELSFTKK